MTIANKITALMVAGNVSDRELADKTCIPRTTLKRRMIRGDWLVVELLSVAKAFGVKFDDVLPDSLASMTEAGAER